MKEGRPSTTAAWVAAWRGIGSFASPAVVVDDIAEHLVPDVYATILRAARRHPAATAAVHQFADLVSRRRSRHLAFRTRAIDEATALAVAGGARQVVIVGAGLDARAWRLAALSDTAVYEVDHPSTQQYKRSRVAELTPLARDVRFVATDFEREDLRERLAAAGHSDAARTVFIWEGVTMYLSGDAIDLVLRGLRTASAPQSTVLATYFEPSRSPFAGALSTVLRGVSEPVKSTFTPNEIASRFRSHDFDVVNDEGDPEWSPRWLGRAQTWSLERLLTSRKV